MLPEFELWVAQDLPDGLHKLADGAPEAVPLAGGTNLIVDLRSGRRRPKIVLSIDALSELKGIRRDDGHVVAGGGVTLGEVLHSPLITQYAPVLRQAAAVFASPLVRNRATLGGNLADGSPAADSAPPLLALDAEVELTSKSGQRWLPLEEFFVGVRQTCRQPDELLTAVRWPVPSPNSAGAFYKLGLRKADAISVASAAVLLEATPDGTCRQARIAMGSVAPVPLRAHAAEDLLRGQLLNAESIAEAAWLSAQAASPISDVRGSDGYRHRIVEVLVRRLLTQAAAEISHTE